MNCTHCEHYNRGRGKRACFSCPEIRTFNRQTIYRKQIAEVKVPTNVLESFADDRPDPAINDLIDRLPEDLADIVTLKYYRRKRSDEEIGQSLGLHRNTVRRKLQLALDLLRREIEQ